MRGRRSTLLLLALVAALPSIGAQSKDPGAQWHHHGSDERSTRYSRLDQINAANVGELQTVWRWPFADAGTKPDPSSPVTPLMVDGVLYFTAGANRTIVAVDAGTGQKHWSYPIREKDRGAVLASGNRGVAYWRPAEGAARVLAISPGYQLVAVDAGTGRVVESFGNDGYVDLWLGLDRDGRVPPGTIGATSPPLVIGDVVVVGFATSDDKTPVPDPKSEYVPGYIRGYDVRTGRRIWTFHTVPRAGQLGFDTWGNGSAVWMGDVGAWAPFSADSELGYVYIPTESPIGNLHGVKRPGANLFANSILCLDARTGRRVWHFQVTHHDLWDWDIPTAPVLLDIVVSGRPVKAVAVITKQAFVFVFDRVTGEPVWPIVERPVPQSTVAGEQTSPTQPSPTRPLPFDYQGFAENDVTNFTPGITARALKLLEQYKLGSLYTPPIVAGEGGKAATLQIPSTGSAVSPGGASADPDTGYLYVRSVTSISAVSLVAASADSGRISGTSDRGLGGNVFEGLGLPLLKPPFGRITAIDLNTGDQAWVVPSGVTPRNVINHPELIAAGIEAANFGGFDRSPLLVTKTLLFSGGQQLRALDKKTGRTVHTLELSNNLVSGGMVTYLHEGRQFLAFPVFKPDGAELIGLALPRGRLN